MSQHFTAHHWFPGRDRLLVLAGAVARTKRVELTYRNTAGRRSVRLVDPLALRYDAGPWILLGWCHLLGKAQGFRVDLMERVRVLRVRAHPEGPVEPMDVGGWSKPRYAGKGDGTRPFRATVRLKGRLIRHAAVLLPGALHERAADGALLCHFQVTDLMALSSQAFSLGKEATVVHPGNGKEQRVVLEILKGFTSP
jgi:predicted DNA-binding transcriptional regulator YafY